MALDLTKFVTPTSGTGAAKSTGLDLTKFVTSGKETTTSAISLDSQNAQDTGAWSPAKTSLGGTQKADNPIQSIGKGLANIIPSAIGFGKGLFNMAKAFAPGNVMGPVNFIKPIIEHPYEALVPEAGRGLVTAAKGAFTGDVNKVQEGLDTTQRSLENDPINSILPFIGAIEGGAAALQKIGLKAPSAGIGGLARAAAATDSTINAFGKLPTKISEAASKTGGSIKTAGEFAARQATGLNASTISEFAKDTTLKPVSAEGLITKREQLGGHIQEALASKKAELGVSHESLGQEVQSALGKHSAALEDAIVNHNETGAAYDPIRTAQAPVKVEADFLKSLVEDNTGLKIDKKGKITPNTTSKIYKPGDVNAIQSFYDRWKPSFDSGKVTPEEFLNMRSHLADMAKYDNGYSKPVDFAGKSMRAKLNSAYRPQVGGLSDLDTTFSKQIGDMKLQAEDLKTLQRGLVDQNGQLSDSGLAKIRKATADKPQLLAQLETITPGITEKLNALHQFDDLGKGLIDSEGNITDGGMKKITNAANEANPQTLARLEEIKPGITKLIKQYKALQDVLAAKDYKVGTYTRAAIGGGGLIAGLMTMNPALIASAIAEMILTSPENAIKIVQTYAKTKEIMSGTIGKLKGGIEKNLTDINDGGPTTPTPKAGATLPNENVPKKSGAFSPKGQGEILSTTKRYNSPVEAMNSPEMKAKWDAVNAQKLNQKVTKTSNNLYHTTSAENIDSIRKDGLTTGNKARFEGVSSKGKISFSANEKGAAYYGGKNDVMIRTKTSYKPTDLSSDLLAGGEGTYTTSKNIPPEALEIKIDGKWKPLTDSASEKKPVAFSGKQKTPLFHGSDAGNLKIDDAGNINFGTAEGDIKQFGKPIKIDTSKLNIKKVASKDELFNIGKDEVKKQALIKQGVDVVIADGHALGINPKTISEKIGVPLREKSYKQQTIEELQSTTDNSNSGAFSKKTTTRTIPGVKHEDIVSVQQFGSSVEGKAKPNDVDHFVIVKDGSMKFKKAAGLPTPIVKNVGKDSYFIMPESEGQNLLDQMLYEGRKDPNRGYQGKTVNLTKHFKPKKTNFGK